MIGGYYRFYPGDYLRDTSGLSLIEHGAYNLLLHYYYSTEGCVNNEKPRLYRLCGAISAPEQSSVDYVVNTFFPSINGKLTNKRADAEIAGRHQYLEEQSRKGKLGGRPRKKPNESRGKAEGKAERKPKGKPGESLPGPVPVPVPDLDPSPKDKKASDLSKSVGLTDGANDGGDGFGATPPSAPAMEVIVKDRAEAVRRLNR
jgi:uncharacterized protein YdaU (DUF1376 family)